MIAAWRRAGWREALRIVWPMGTLTAISFLTCGFWSLSFAIAPTFWWNASLWPTSPLTFCSIPGRVPIRRSCSLKLNSLLR